MANATVDDLDETEANRRRFTEKLSNPASFLWTMLIFLIIVGFVCSILYRQAAQAFQTNPGLNV